MNLNAAHLVNGENTRLLTIQITAATVETDNSGLGGFSAGTRGGRPGHTHEPNAHVGAHTHSARTWVAHSQIDTHRRTGMRTHSRSLSQLQSSPLDVLHSTDSTGPLGRHALVEPIGLRA